MLDYTRERVRDTLRPTQTAVLATSGPSGAQAGEFPCEAIGLDLYFLLPQTSDHLFNLEKDNRVDILTKDWELRGQAHVLLPNEELPQLTRPDMHRSEWHVLVRVKPIQIHILNQTGWGAAETFDLASNG
jgi:hypothetical protein